MNFKIRQATQDDCYQVGYVHYKSWLETYRGIVEDNYLDNLNLDSRINRAHLYIDRCIVSTVNDKIVGFLSYSNKEDKTFMEINALYILEEYHFNGLGKAMVSVVEKMFTNNEKIKLWVSVKNKNAINFYERVGFKFNGVTDTFKIGNERIEVIQLSKKVEA